MFSRFRPLLLPLIVIVLLAFTLPASSADELLERAAALVRTGQYADAYALAVKSADSPQRSFMLGTIALRLGKADEALLLLVQAEQKLPLIGDYAALYQAEALLLARRYAEAGARAAMIPKSYPQSQVLRRAAKLTADAAFEARDFKAALAAYQTFVEKYPSGADSIDALFQAARSREESGDPDGALKTYRNIWLNNPVAPQSHKAELRIKALELHSAGVGSATSAELLKRASFQYARNRFTDSLKTLEAARAATPPEAAVGRIDLRAGLAHYRLRQYTQSEKYLSRAANSGELAIASEARFWLGKTLDRMGRNPLALKVYLDLAAEGRQQSYADDALMEAAALQRSLGQYSEAARLFAQVTARYPESRFAGRSVWESGWSHYLAGEYSVAAAIFKTQLKDETQREKLLYWFARALENAGSKESVAWYQTLVDEFPAGFYAAWHRERTGLKDTRAGLGQINALALLPRAAGFEKPHLLASLGLLAEARVEMAAVRKKSGDKKGLFPVLARTYLEMGDYSSSIALFMRNRPSVWEKGTLPLWSAGYPLAYSDLVVQQAALNGLSEGLVFALIRAESGFSPTATSSAGAIGLMQMMPNTARQTAREKGEFNPQRLKNPEYNIRLGTRHLRDLMKGYNNDVVAVAAAYNAGSGTLERWKKNLKGLQKDEFIESIPYQETRDYVKKVYASAATYRQLYGLK